MNWVFQALSEIFFSLNDFLCHDKLTLFSHCCLRITYISPKHKSIAGLVLKEHIRISTTIKPFWLETVVNIWTKQSLCYWLIYFVALKHSINMQEVSWRSNTLNLNGVSGQRVPLHLITITKIYRYLIDSVRLYTMF